jgi:hypothetical protein
MIDVEGIDHISDEMRAVVCTEDYIRIDLTVESRLLALERQKLGRSRFVGETAAFGSRQGARSALNIVHPKLLAVAVPGNRTRSDNGAGGLR